MTTEQKEAIEKLQQKLNPKEFGGYCVLGYNQKYCFGKSEVEAIETVLNLIQEQERENENLRKELNEENKRCMILANNDKFKEQVIDLMSEFVDTELSSQRLGIVLNQKVDPLQSYKKEIKQYFERKVENDNLEK